MKKQTVFSVVFLILFELLILTPVLSYQKVYRAHDIVKFIEAFERAQKEVGIKIIGLDFERKNGKISGVIEVFLTEEERKVLNEFLKKNKININITESGRIKIYAYESYFTSVPKDFYSAFRYSLITMLTNKNFYLLIILFVVFYTLILPNLLKI